MLLFQRRSIAFRKHVTRDAPAWDSQVADFAQSAFMHVRRCEGDWRASCRLGGRHGVRQLQGFCGVARAGEPCAARAVVARGELQEVLRQIHRH
eukprot:6211159-Pleurochrysis_carterae.AAC.1